MPEPKTFLGFPVVIVNEMPKGMAVMGRFDEMWDGFQVQAIVAVADVPDADNNLIIYTADCLRQIAKDDSRFTFNEENKSLVMHGVVKGSKIYPIL